MLSSTQETTPLEGISYFTPSPEFILSGRDGRVSIRWGERPPLPLLTEDFEALATADLPDYDMAGRGLYQALRLNPDCFGASAYASLLADAYPHIISELGGQIIMLEAREVDSPYLDRKINYLKIMALLDPTTPALPLEIARTYIEKGSRLSCMQHAVNCWYSAEDQMNKALALNPADHVVAYEYGEVLYVLGRYEKSMQIWSEITPMLEPERRLHLEKRIAAIKGGTLPLVPPLDYLTALSVAVEQQQNGYNHEAAAIVSDVLSDDVFTEQFPVNELYYFMGTCYQAAGMIDEAAEAFRRS